MLCSKVIVKIAIVGLYITSVLSCQDVSGKRSAGRVDWTMKVVSGSSKPVIDKDDPGAKDNIGGFENGAVVKLKDGSYHMVITEMFKDGGSVAGYWVPARIGHWVSTDKGNTWSRLGTIVQGNNLPDDPKNNTWSAHWYFDSIRDKWNVIWRGLSADFRYASDQTGDKGIAGNYSQVSQMIPPLYGKRKWWESKFPDSFSNIFRAENGRYYAFIGSAFRGSGQVADPDGGWNWYVGLATAKNVDGPWYQDSSKTDPDLIFAENPIVIKEHGTYFAVFDDLLYQLSIGYAYSTDGIHWTQKSLDLTKYVTWCANSPQISETNPGGLVKSLRTPCSLIKEGDNYVIIFTGYNKNSSYFDVGKIVVSLNRS